ncbi:MAG: hypothetical protein ACUVT7_05635 [Thermoplasmata archaeon]
MTHQVLDVRLLAAIACCLMSSMVMLSSAASPPVVSISHLPQLEPGTVVSVIGMLVDQWIRDDGSMSLVLADASDGATARIVCGAFEPLGVEPDIRIGDEIMATGEVSSSKHPPTVFAEANKIVLLRGAEYVLTVGILSSNWMLFVNDKFYVRGVVEEEPSSGDFCLLDESANCSVLLASYGDLSCFVEAEVVVNGYLNFDRNTMSLVLSVETVSLAS